MITHQFDGFLSVNFAIILLFLGKTAVSRIEILRRYSIPEPVIGGFLCTALVAICYYFFNLKVTK